MRAIILPDAYMVCLLTVATGTRYAFMYVGVIPSTTTPSTGAIYITEEAEWYY